MKYLKLLVILLFPVIFLLTWWNKSLVTTNFIISNKNIPENFSNSCIVQISDLHNAMFGKNNSRLVNKIKNEKPDIIVITGDMIDSRRTDFQVGYNFVEQVVEIAPTYYVIGNHETRIYDGYSELEEQMKKIGVHVLRNQSELIEVDGDTIQMIGVDDPDIYSNDPDTNKIMTDTLTTLNDSRYYTILLSHRPELLDIYSDTNIDLVFAGHVHGGQVRVPFVGGLVGPHQGLLPEYDAGLYTEENTNMILSRGLGNSLFPFRINNRPEITVTRLQHEI